VRLGDDTWIVGVLVQTNFGGRLTMHGVPVWRELLPRPRGDGQETSADGSCMIVVATDAPMTGRNLRRLAARAIYAMARAGSTFSNGSGDFAIAFSTHPSLRVSGGSAPQQKTVLPTDAVSGLFEATLDATEEAIYNSMLRATDTSSGSRTVRALPVADLEALFTKYGR
jgi:D-aminopeptidase